MADIKGNGTSLLSAVAAFVFLLGGMYALVRPMDQRISQMENQVKTMRDLAERNQDNMAKHVLCVTKNETKLGEVSARVTDLEQWRVWWNRDMMTNQVQLGEKIKQLERQAYGGVSPQISGE